MANGVRQKEITEKVGLTEARVSQITKGRDLNNLSEYNEINTLNLNQTSVVAELARLQAEKKRAEATANLLRRQLAEMFTKDHL